MKENQHIEWKESWRDEYLKWICGFANAEGGVLVIGRNDKGAVVGVKDARKLMEDVPNKVRDILGIMVDVNQTEEAGKEILEIIVEAYPYPVSYKGEYFYRSGSTKQELKGAALDRFLLRKQGLHWDGAPLPHIAVGDLDSDAFAYFRKQALKSQRLTPEILDEPDDLLLDKLHLVEGKYLKRAVALLSQKKPVKSSPLELLLRATAAIEIFAFITHGIWISLNNNLQNLFTCLFTHIHIHHNAKDIAHLVRNILHQLPGIFNANNSSLIVSPNNQHSAFGICKAANPFQVLVPPGLLPLDVLVFFRH